MRHIDPAECTRGERWRAYGKHPKEPPKRRGRLKLGSAARATRIDILTLAITLTTTQPDDSDGEEKRRRARRQATGREGEEEKKARQEESSPARCGGRRALFPLAVDVELHVRVWRLLVSRRQRVARLERLLEKVVAQHEAWDDGRVGQVQPQHIARGLGLRQMHLGGCHLGGSARRRPRLFVLGLICLLRVVGGRRREEKGGFQPPAPPPPPPSPRSAYWRPGTAGGEWGRLRGDCAACGPGQQPTMMAWLS